ncbi:hypothetical protein E4U43_006595 [Claviceps pusilla]|uniref:Uncharacterized protein n=1 Tax=Claviceps pusilla TaxID=123648 RepID=A0A9P7N0T7_9HYPO|nr:hypothetical protein E4U43_006595 [Claviceps pusilla]
MSMPLVRHREFVSRAVRIRFANKIIRFVDNADTLLDAGASRVAHDPLPPLQQLLEMIAGKQDIWVEETS